MKTLLIFYALYFFLCVGFKTTPTPEGLLLPIIMTGVLAVLSVGRANREVSIYIDKEQLDKAMEEEDGRW